MSSTLHIMLLSSAFNGLTQRAWLALKEAGCRVSVQLFTTESDVISAFEHLNPDIVICPFLKDKVPDVLWQNDEKPIVIIHPGIVGDRGASALDWTIMNSTAIWGQAAKEMDAGPVWVSHEFSVPKAIRKSALYNGKVSDAAMRCIFDTLALFIEKKQPVPLDYTNPDVKGRLQPNMMQRDRKIEWNQPAKAIIRVINAADGMPGAQAEIEGNIFYLYDAQLSEHQGAAGKLLAYCHEAVLIGTGDKSIWIGALKQQAITTKTVKYPATQVLRDKIRDIPVLPGNVVTCVQSDNEYCSIQYRQSGQVGEITLNFYNGAMSTEQCYRLRDALRFAKKKETTVLVLKGGWNAFSNGINLNTIEVADNPAEEAWRNIVAIDDVCLEILEAKQWVISAVTGSAGAGGVMLALTADAILARQGIVFNPHYMTMGLYGSEYWTYTLPRRIGQEKAVSLTTQCLPISENYALQIGMIDLIGPREQQAFTHWLTVQSQLAVNEQKIKTKIPHDMQRAALCRDAELAQMREDIFHDHHHFSEKRRCFVFKTKPCKTPSRLNANDNERLT